MSIWSQIQVPSGVQNLIIPHIRQDKGSGGSSAASFASTSPFLAKASPITSPYDVRRTQQNSGSISKSHREQMMHGNNANNASLSNNLGMRPSSYSSLNDVINCGSQGTGLPASHFMAAGGPSNYGLHSPHGQRIAQNTHPAHTSAQRMVLDSHNFQQHHQQSHGNSANDLVSGNENGPAGSGSGGQVQKRKYTKRKERTRRSATTSDGMRICPECNSSFSSYSSLYVHKKSHLNVRYECAICKEDFKWPYMLYNHRKNVHGAVTPGRRGRPKKDTEGQLGASNHHASGANNGLPSP